MWWICLKQDQDLQQNLVKFSKSIFSKLIKGIFIGASAPHITTKTKVDFVSCCLARHDVLSTKPIRTVAETFDWPVEEEGLECEKEDHDDTAFWEQQKNEYLQHTIR